mmetsp:Transcript_13623/g.37644  ORF Transcript_13623/g.37644 Transcript_13623/m.37644 type:complete len:275 (-) Transcript_13623:103-927(-)|eukprot:CAMPEP_0168770030 /NCGR_PEP_ID=MMETSP0725-20121227/2703_1 /TAXON_ID=265536 /ORGANISM="Amphiprora sp., Strain CCMP467" /LENGTH=274 /DNA_ID=CAMNT_0008819449 /DNA_START=49 /DNA_END=873 /DNA_ORIENTATION=+
MTRYQVSLWAHSIKYGGCFKGRPNCYATLEDKSGQILGRTETVEDARDPDWVKILFVEAEASQYTPITVKVYHENTYDDDLLGEASFEVKEVNLSPGHMDSKSIGDDSSDTKVSISVVESNPEHRGTAQLQFRGLDIKNIEPGPLGLGRSDPFFEVAKKTAEPGKGIARWNVVYRSEVIEDHLNPFWNPFEISLEELCDGDLDSRLQVAIYDSRKGTNRLIGSIEGSINQLKERVGIRGNADREQAFELGLEETGRGTTTGTGLLCVLKCDITQ